MLLPDGEGLAAATVPARCRDERIRIKGCRTQLVQEVVQSHIGGITT